MKKISIILISFLTIVGNVLADNRLTVSDVVIPYGSKVAIEINCDFETSFKGYQLDIDLQEGMSLELNEAGTPIGENGFATDHAVSSNKISDTKYRFAVLSFTGQSLGQTGTLLRVYVKAEDGMEIGTSCVGKISAIEFTTDDLKPYHFEEIPFNLTVGEPADTRIVLDEESNVLPVTANGVDVRVKRVIKTDLWNSIVLPFNMTNEQVKTAFGNDVEIAGFTGWETTEYDNNDNPTAISVTFTEVDAIEANKPYIIKLSSDIEEFIVDGVDIRAEDEPCITVGKINRGTFGSFTGSYIPTVVDEETLILNDGKFLYSDGTAVMKGYRAYFYFQDILGNYDAQEGAKIEMIIKKNNSDPTYIGSMDADTQTENHSFNLSGMKVADSTKGLIIKKGKKYVIK